MDDDFVQEDQPLHLLRQDFFGLLLNRFFANSEQMLRDYVSYGVSTAEKDQTVALTGCHNKKANMKILTSATRIAAALTFISAFAVNAAQPTAPQRAAANHFELAPIGAPKNTALPKFVVAPRPGGGKMWAQILEARRPVSGEKGLDIVHAPRPITASKDPDLERKWRANAIAIRNARIK